MKENAQEKKIQYSELSFEELKDLAKKGDAKAQNKFYETVSQSAYKKRYTII